MQVDSDPNVKHTANIEGSAAEEELILDQEEVITEIPESSEGKVEPPTADKTIEINLGTAENPLPIFISENLDEREKAAYIALLSEFRDIFAWTYAEMPGLDPKIKVHQLNIREDAKPWKQAQRKFAPEIMMQIEKEVQKLIEVGFLREEQHSDWVANIVPVKKKTGQIRICIDFRDLNQACPKDEYPLPITEIMIDNTFGYERMSFLDGFSGYNQIKMDPEDEKHTAFRTPFGIYCYTVMPFGLKNAGATYQRAMMKIFKDIQHKTVECYVDDLAIKSRYKKDHVRDLRRVFERLRKFKLRMNPLKCFFGVSSGKFLGHLITKDGIRVDPAKAQAILEMPPPRTVKELKSIQGRHAYIRRFISNLSG